MTPENKAKKRIKEILEAHGCWYVMAVPGGYGRKGIPDFLICVNGRFLAIEAKRLDGKGEVSALQARELDAIRSAGGVALLIEDEEGMKYLEEVLKGLKDEF